MREFAESFYKSKTWVKCRNAYAKSVGYMCEDCAKKGINVPGEIVHHINHIEPWNINNPEITLSWNNLEYLCRPCHASKHGKAIHRYKVDEGGNVISIGE